MIKTSQLQIKLPWFRRFLDCQAYVYGHGQNQYIRLQAGSIVVDVYANAGAMRQLADQIYQAQEGTQTKEQIT